MSAIYLSPSVKRFVPKYMAFSTWVGHLPFAYDLVAALRPSVVVELGTYRGVSFFSFCQSIAEHAVAGDCYAVDTWRGDKHTGGYGEEIHLQVLEHARREYPNQAHLLRMRFNDAAREFGESSIDLLHIDGLHTYEAVREDFETWYPKVRPGGIILFHDVVARLSDFGVWRFWEETCSRFETFAFRHGFGLGVLRKPGGQSNSVPLFELLFGKDGGQQSALRQYYVAAAEYVVLRHWLSRFAQHGNSAPPAKKRRGSWRVWRRAG